MGSLKNWTNLGATSPEQAALECVEPNDTSDVNITECSSSPTVCKSPKDVAVEEPEKENYTPNKSYKTVICGRTPTLITCYSPAPTNAENYASVVVTPRSVYSTPIKGGDLSEFSTPNHNSMHLVDLTTTPKTLAPSTPTSSLRCTAVQGFSSSPIVLSDTDTSPDDSKSVPSSSSEPKSPEKTSKRPAVNATPKRTPQSLMKRAILTSAKKAGHTPVSRRSLMAISEKSHSITRKTPVITPKMNKLTDDRLNLSLRNMEESKSPVFASANKMKWTPDKKISLKRVQSATKAVVTPDSIKIKAAEASRKSMFAGSVNSTSKPSISALRKSMVALSKAKSSKTSTMVSEMSSVNDTCDMEGISELMKTPMAMERSKTFIVDTPTDKVFNSSMSKNLMMAMSPNQSVSIASNVSKDLMEEISTTVDMNSTVEISGIDEDLLKDEIVVEEVCFFFGKIDFFKNLRSVGENENLDKSFLGQLRTFLK